MGAARPCGRRPARGVVLTADPGPPGETRREREERIYARAEEKLARVNARRVRRGPETLLAVLIAMCLAVGLVAAVDLRRLQTPRGTALAWTGAAVFGDCTAYGKLSADLPGATADPRPERERCLALRRATEQSRADASAIGIDLVRVEPAPGDAATAQVRVSRRDGETTVPLQMRREGAGWVVLRTAETCAAVGGCP